MAFSNHSKTTTGSAAEGPKGEEWLLRQYMKRMYHWHNANEPVEETDEGKEPKVEASTAEVPDSAYQVDFEGVWEVRHRGTYTYRVSPTPKPGQSSEPPPPPPNSPASSLFPSPPVSAGDPEEGKGTEKPEEEKEDRLTWKERLRLFRRAARIELTPKFQWRVHVGAQRRGQTLDSLSKEALEAEVAQRLRMWTDFGGEELYPWRFHKSYFIRQCFFDKWYGHDMRRAPSNQRERSRARPSEEHFPARVNTRPDELTRAEEDEAAWEDVPRGRTRERSDSASARRDSRS